jgi:hypothetical protein
MQENKKEYLSNCKELCKYAKMILQTAKNLAKHHASTPALRGEGS